MLILTQGPFGDAVADQIGRHTSIVRQPLTALRDDAERLLNDQDFVGVASWRPYPGLYRELDRQCWERGIRWSLVELHGQALICGPLVVPGAGPCFHCYQKRTASHHSAPEREQTLLAEYERNETLGPDGFLPPMVEIGASSLLGDATAPSSRAGQFRRIDVLASTLLESEVIAVHRCPRCRAPVEDPQRRHVEHLIPALEGLQP